MVQDPRRLVAASTTRSEAAAVHDQTVASAPAVAHVDSGHDRSRPPRTACLVHDVSPWTFPCETARTSRSHSLKAARIRTLRTDACEQTDKIVRTSSLAQFVGPLIRCTLPMTGSARTYIWTWHRRARWRSRAVTLTSAAAGCAGPWADQTVRSARWVSIAGRCLRDGSVCVGKGNAVALRRVVPESADGVRLNGCRQPRRQLSIGLGDHGALVGVVEQ